MTRDQGPRHRETVRRPSSLSRVPDPTDAVIGSTDDVFAEAAEAAEADQTPMWGRNEQSSTEEFSNESEAVRVDASADRFHIVHGDQLAGHYGGGTDGEEQGYGNEPHAVRADRVDKATGRPSKRARRKA